MRASDWSIYILETRAECLIKNSEDFALSEDQASFQIDAQ